MTRQREDDVVRLVRVFVFSPRDVKDERAVLDEVVQRMNGTTNGSGRRSSSGSATSRPRSGRQRRRSFASENA